MTDLLVKLYDLPEERPKIADSIKIRAINPAEISIASDFVEKTFSRRWKDEFERGAHAVPISSIIAVKERHILGFACYDASGPGLFGPTGVDPEYRGQNIGAALLFAALDAMIAKGYSYAIIGGVGPVEFYEKLVGATVIKGSENRYFADLLQVRK